MFRHAHLLVPLVLALALGVPPARAEPSPYVFRIRAHVGPRAAVNPSWLDTQIARANVLFSGAHVGFVRDPDVLLPASLYVIERQSALRLTTSLLDPTVIDVFVVDALDGLDDETGEVLGITEVRRQSARHCVLLEANEPRDSVLAHELGHYFGLRHARDRANLMFTHTTRIPQSFDRAQEQAIATRAAGYALSRRPAPIRGGP